LVKKDQPITITVVDTEKLAKLIPEIEQMMDTGMIATSDVESIWIELTPGV
jgi:PII-like signaling protein